MPSKNTPRPEPRDYLRKHEPFTFRLGDETHSLPTDLSIRQMDRLQSSEGDLAAMLAILAEIVGGDLTDRLTDLPAADFRDVVRDWMTVTSGGDLGNSPGSSS